MGGGETIHGCSSSCRGSRHNSSQKRNSSSSVGCMSGILHLLTRHHSRRSNKRLSPAPKKADHIPLSLNTPSKPPIFQLTKPTKLTDPFPTRQSLCELQRSPTIPVELRRSDSPRRSDSQCRPSVAVARLMGLDMTTAPAQVEHPPESATEKRRRLLGALEKCDEDLKALKRIIEAVRLAEVRMVGLDCGKVTDGADLRKRNAEAEVVVENVESPNSVLDRAIYSPRFRSNINESRSSNVAAGSKIVKPSRMGVNFGEHQKSVKDNTDHQERHHHHRPLVNEGIPKEIITNNSALQNWHVRDATKRHTTAAARSIEEICEAVALEQGNELEMIKAMVEWGIFGDLVEEVIMELYFCFNKLSVTVTLKRTCRKRLYF